MRVTSSREPAPPAPSAVFTLTLNETETVALATLIGRGHGDIIEGAHTALVKALADAGVRQIAHPEFRRVRGLRVSGPEA